MHSGKRVVYWAEDDSDDMEIFRAVLQELAPEIQLSHFENGKMLLDQLEGDGSNEYPTLIILDINMPVLDGRETLIRLKRDDRYKAIPMVVLTTSSSALDKAFCDHMNTEMLTKPFSYEEVKAVLGKVLYDKGK